MIHSSTRQLSWGVKLAPDTGWALAHSLPESSGGECKENAFCDAPKSRLWQGDIPSALRSEGKEPLALLEKVREGCMEEVAQRGLPEPH